MIAISSMTVADVVAAVEMRAGDLMTPYNSDWVTMVKYVRDARRDLFSRTNPFKEWAYQQSVQLTHLQTLPADYMRPIRVTTSLPGANPALGVRYEARRISPYEWMTVCNSRGLSFTRGREKAPVYMIWVNNTDSVLWAASQPALWLSPSNLVAQLDYVANFGDADISAYSDTVKVPTEMESLLIDMTLARFLDDVADAQRAVTAAQDVAQRVFQYQSAQVSAKQSQGIEAQALPNPEPASVRPNPGSEGGLI